VGRSDCWTAESREALSWFSLTPSVPEVPAAMWVMVRSLPCAPTESAWPDGISEPTLMAVAPSGPSTALQRAKQRDPVVKRRASLIKQLVDRYLKVKLQRFN
jgi:hypothetical protein